MTNVEDKLNYYITKSNTTEWRIISSVWFKLRLNSVKDKFWEQMEEDHEECEIFFAANFVGRVESVYQTKGTTK